MCRKHCQSYQERDCYGDIGSQVAQFTKCFLKVVAPFQYTVCFIYYDWQHMLCEFRHPQEFGEPCILKAHLWWGYDDIVPSHFNSLCVISVIKMQYDQILTYLMQIVCVWITVYHNSADTYFIESLSLQNRVSKYRGQSCEWELHLFSFQSIQWWYTVIMTSLSQELCTNRGSVTVPFLYLSMAASTLRLLHTHVTDMNIQLPRLCQLYNYLDYTASLLLHVSWLRSHCLVVTAQLITLWLRHGSLYIRPHSKGEEP